MEFTYLDASRIVSSLDGNVWSLKGEPNQAHAKLLELVDPISDAHLGFGDFNSHCDRLIPLVTGLPGKVDWPTAWRFHQLGHAGFEMIFNVFRDREIKSFDLRNASEASNPIWGVISNRQISRQGGDPLKAHLASADETKPRNL